jgi:putative acetyltransferase
MTAGSNDQITVRRAEPADYEAVARVVSGPRAVWGTLQVPHPSLEQWRKRMAEPAEGLVLLVACAGGEVVGQAGLHTQPLRPRRRHVGEIGMAVRDDWQGKGVGTALMREIVELSDRWLNLVRLELTVFTDNEPAIRLYKRCGFTIEGTLTAYAFRDGEFVDAYAMARLRRPGA